MGNPQGGDDCLDALGTYGEVEATREEDMAGGEADRNKCDFADKLACHNSTPSLSTSFLNRPTTKPNNGGFIDPLGCMPNPMDAVDENDVGSGEMDIERELTRQEYRRRKGSNIKRSSNSILNDTETGHLPLHVENDIEQLGKFLSLMQPQDLAKAHEFGPTLDEYAVNGVPVDCGDNWSREAIEEAVARGPHQSAMTPEAIELFHDDVVKYQVDAGFCRIVNWDDIKNDLPPQLKISPVAAVPQVGRRPRIILDLSFPVRVGNEIIQQAVNATTAKTSHPKALDYLGSAMPRILKFLAHAPSEYPVYLSKYDISDGFWRMVVAAGSEWNFAYVLPQEEGKPIRLVVPNALQMGWKESPGYFCSASETARDVAEDLAGFTGKMHDLPHHKLEDKIKMPPSTGDNDTATALIPDESSLKQESVNSPKANDDAAFNDSQPPCVIGDRALRHSDDIGTALTSDDATPSDLNNRSTPWAALEVFVDDFIAMCQDVSRIKHFTRAILHGIESVFPTQEITGHVNGRAPISEKKVDKGDADWTVVKEVLGWLIDGENRTIELPEAKAQAYLAELKKLRKKKSIPLKRFREIVGKLRFAAICLPAGKALMTPLNMALKGTPASIGNGKKSEVAESLGDWQKLIESLASRPTSVHELVAKSIDYYGYCDACNTGAGGVWLSLHSDLDPFIWRVPWPTDIAKRLAEYEDLSINDGEAAGVLLHQMALESDVEDLTHKKALPFCDNTSAVSWVTRMASRQSRIGGRLAKGIAMRARSRRMCLPEAVSIQGKQNDMADVASRSFSAASGYMFSDAELLTHFNSHFPLPQNRSWRVVTLPPEDISKVVSTLRGQRLTMAQWTSRGGRSTGATGAPSLNSGESPRSSRVAANQPKPTSCQPLLSGLGRDTTVEATQSLLSQLTELSEPLGRPSNWLADPTRPRLMEAVSESFNSAGL